ncbi:MAG TPA: 5'-3' exonuclease H3TH domain-containing protein, partial [Burkholderiales bacterium]
MEKTLLLVDGSSYLYRAFHALPDLRNAAGEPTGAIYGVLNMLRRLLADYKADYVACVFDARGKTFRDDMYAQYKANRPPMPDDLGAQVEPLFDAIRASGWPLLQIEGVEADDVIGTLALAAGERGFRCVISTGDKDLTQLVTDRVTLVNTMSNERLDPDGVKAKFGVPPDRMLDYLTLVGDSVDNVPGVDKVGPKTAAKWLSQYGSLEEVVRHAAEIGGAVGENLLKALDWLPQARALLAVKCDVKLPFDLEQLKLAPKDEKRLSELISHFGFKTWSKEAAGGAREPAGDASKTAGNASEPAQSAAPVRNNPERRYETLIDKADLARWLKELEAADLVAVDTETTSLDPFQARLVGMSFSIASDRAAYLPLGHNYAGAPAQLSIEAALATLK